MYEGKWIALFGWNGPVGATMRQRLATAARAIAADKPAGVVAIITNPPEQAMLVALRNLMPDLAMVGVYAANARLEGSAATVRTLCRDVLPVPAEPPCRESTIEGAVLSMARTKAKGSAGTAILALHASLAEATVARVAVLGPIWNVPVNVFEA